MFGNVFAILADIHHTQLVRSETFRELGRIDALDRVDFFAGTLPRINASLQVPNTLS
jgi:hypothetical protein